MDAAARRLLDSAEFRRLITRRWRVSLVLTAALFVLYYGFILLVGLDRGLLATRVGRATTLGIPLGMAVIVGAWILTAIYVWWANRHYDREVHVLRGRIER
jgi:uncharacterized membrane protein (DUF485 family)